jgi:hypothetical protein
MRDGLYIGRARAVVAGHGMTGTKFEPSNWPPTVQLVKIAVTPIFGLLVKFPVYIRLQRTFKPQGAR